MTMPSSSTKKFAKLQSTMHLYSQTNKSDEKAKFHQVFKLHSENKIDVSAVYLGAFGSSCCPFRVPPFKSPQRNPYVFVCCALKESNELL
jgi:hypothetical protein